MWLIVCVFVLLYVYSSIHFFSVLLDKKHQIGQLTSYRIRLIIPIPYQLGNSYLPLHIPELTFVFHSSW